MILDLGKVRHKKIEYDVNEKGCWICTSHCKDKDGYAKIFVFNKHLRLHRYIYTILKGNIPENMVIRHKCDNPSCINPEHLEIGTVRDNVMDKINRGRLPVVLLENLKTGQQMRGEQVGTSKLTELQVKEIKKSNLPQKELAAIYGVCRQSINDIINGKKWGWVKP